MNSHSEAGSSSPRPQNKPGHLPRLPPEFYQADAVIHWNICLRDRRKNWLSQRFHAALREILLHSLFRETLICPVYCLMPDHLHLVWMGMSLESNQKHAMSFFRTHLNRLAAPLEIQHQPHDHVLRASDRRKGAFRNVCSYIIQNPVRAQLVAEAGEWEYCGALIPGYPTLDPRQPDYWTTFWKLHAQLFDKKAETLARPWF